MSRRPGMLRLGLLSALLIVLLPSVSIAQQAVAASYGIPASTPAGIMLVEVHQERGSSSDPYFWTRLGDAEGWTLFYFVGEGAAAGDFKPLLGADDATAFDDWSLVPNRGSMQWAYQGHPLYVWPQEKEPGEIALNVVLYGVGPNGEDPLQENRSGATMPPEGWRVARYTPSNTAKIPDGFDLRLVDSGQGVVLTDFAGFSLYSFESAGGDRGDACNDRSCYEHWSPIAAPALAGGFGDFAVIDRVDGTRQWAFQGKPLFRFDGDLLPGDVNGRSAHPQLQLALLKENYRPDGVAVMSLPGYGDIFTLQGRTLYFGSAFEKYWGGRNLRGSFEIAYHKGKRLGGNACVSGECLLSWRPFLAPQGAIASGFWEIVPRQDGTRQWAYKGFALYTYNEDQGPGQIRGHNLYDIADVDGDAESMARTRLLAEVGNAPGGAGIYWSLAKP
jgi:predicted lipoprotein with Yx(FWY)xxD motif